MKWTIRPVLPQFPPFQKIFLLKFPTNLTGENKRKCFWTQFLLQSTTAGPKQSRDYFLDSGQTPYHSRIHLAQTNEEEIT